VNSVVTHLGLECLDPAEKESFILYLSQPQYPYIWGTSQSNGDEKGANPFCYKSPTIVRFPDNAGFSPVFLGTGYPWCPVNYRYPDLTPVGMPGEYKPYLFITPQLDINIWIMGEHDYYGFRFQVLYSIKGA